MTKNKKNSGKMFKDLKITKRQEADLIEDMRKNEVETIYICEDCKIKLKGLIKVRKHCGEFKHYTYKNPKFPGILGFC